VVFEDDDEPNKSQRPVPPQVFLVVLSENCIMWNNIRIGKEHKPILLTDGDTIGISPTDNFIFRSKAVKKFPFSDAQARDTLVSLHLRNKLRGIWIADFDLQFFQNEYEIAERVLGVGGFGRVHLAVNKVTGEQLACKVISISHLTREVVKLQGMERPELGDPAEDLRLRRGGRKHIEKIMRQMKTHDKEHEILAKLDHVSSQTTSRHPKHSPR
jgi:protein-serine/threonine kinase